MISFNNTVNKSYRDQIVIPKDKKEQGNVQRSTNYHTNSEFWPETVVTGGPDGPDKITVAPWKQQKIISRISICAQADIIKRNRGDNRMHL